MDYIELTSRITPLEGRDILMAELAELGYESFVDTPEGLLAYIQKNDFKAGSLNEVNIFKNTDFETSYDYKIIEDQNWNEVWEKSFDPINIDNICYIRAPFHQKEDSIEFDIIIEPKMSFGTGHHETTALMVKKILSLELENKTVLDMGCGTGVLAILAKLKKASDVMAVDIDEWAYRNTIENIEKNNNLSIEVKQGGAEVISNRQFDLIIANINRNILLQDLKNYSKSLQQEGSILLSGFFLADKEVLLEEAQKYQLRMIEIATNNDWALLHLIKL
ncbi:MAG: 50S ribosomal protein L11 methyltransferase [Vicingus serpentipes]|nr:50S ribosomal protein L11 methyltransferase [Vicingus serpentipes]